MLTEWGFESVALTMTDNQLPPEHDIHVVPLGDIIEHDCSRYCACQPTWDEVNKKEFMAGFADRAVWVHKRLRDILQ